MMLENRRSDCMESDTIAVNCELAYEFIFIEIPKAPQ